mmetsp:Transcript_3027/g.10633  ORF Transcript_3027/g.10633 Transcript_3027/m.10633 type:complete len:292 (-) Transcript_3027:23-898(-)
MSPLSVRSTVKLNPPATWTTFALRGRPGTSIGMVCMRRTTCRAGPVASPPAYSCSDRCTSMRAYRLAVRLSASIPARWAPGPARRTGAVAVCRSPHASAAPSLVTHRLWKDPAATCATRSLPRASTVLSSLASSSSRWPSPSWPSLLRPHARTVPVSSSTRVCDSPHATWHTRRPSAEASSLGTGSSGRAAVGGDATWQPAPAQKPLSGPPLGERRRRSAEASRAGRAALCARPSCPLALDPHTYSIALPSARRARGRVGCARVSRGRPAARQVRGRARAEVRGRWARRPS